EIDFETQGLEQTLKEAGFTAGAKTFFTWEGVPMYLTRTAVKATLDAVSAISGAGSVIAHDMWYLVDDPSPMGTARRLAPNALSFIGEPVTFSIHPEEMDFFLGRHGFHIKDLVVSAELQQRYAPGARVLTDDSMYVLAAERADTD
ncbi:MAG: class I SAM-dependent methyltransferase, partial [Actinobacteria bacterium]|nr:class I SAM-dependent methyltransferase [Actinomycetota bacterium]